MFPRAYGGDVRQGMCLQEAPDLGRIPRCPWPPRDWSSTDCQTLDSLSNGSLSNALHWHCTASTRPRQPSSGAARRSPTRP
eukprot:4338408-Pyramimonas_sp.AAC.1